MSGAHKRACVASSQRFATMTAVLDTLRTPVVSPSIRWSISTRVSSRMARGPLTPANTAPGNLQAGDHSVRKPLADSLRHDLSASHEIAPHSQILTPPASPI